MENLKLQLNVRNLRKEATRLQLAGITAENPASVAAAEALNAAEKVRDAYWQDGSYQAWMERPESAQLPCGLLLAVCISSLPDI